MTNGLPWSGGNIAHAAWGDYDNDGNLDIAIHSTTGTSIYRNDGSGSFTILTNIAIPTVGVPAWTDYDNDGHLDLLLVNGQDMSSGRAYLYHNNGDGTFTSINDSLTTVANYWLVGAWGDYDNDGFMDVLLTQQYGSNKLFHNLRNTNHWIKFKLVGTVSNRDAIGAKVRVRATIAGQTVWQLQEVNGGYALQNDMRPNFGLGDATNVDLVRIEWPSGNVQELSNLSADHIIPVTETVRVNPTRPTGSLGATVSLTSVTVGTYQWRSNGVDLIGQTNRILTLTNLTADMAGAYSVVVSNATSYTTNFTYLTMDTQFTKITSGEALVSTFTSLPEPSWVDVDGDGDLDLVITGGYWASGGERINVLVNDGNGVFTRLHTGGLE
ncbi:MAG: FG-GAP-like repeat-containing protein [Verrucomicrobiota bacterium]